VHEQGLPDEGAGEAGDVVTPSPAECTTGPGASECTRRDLNPTLFRWTAPGLPWGATQLDFVFGERMPVAHQMLDVVLTPERHAELQVAPKDLSLAWKLLWLHSDMHPRGKDLYDAMLLAEATTLQLPLLQAVFEIADSKLPPPEDLISFGNAFEWVGFEQQNESTVDASKQRLARALGSERREKLMVR